MNVIADQSTAGFECDIPVEAPILALDLRVGTKAGVGSGVILYPLLSRVAAVDHQGVAGYKGRG